MKELRKLILKFTLIGPTYQARLDLQKTLGALKQVGRHFEPHRPGKKTANVFVPALFFIVSSQTDKKAPKHFLEVPLVFENLPRRPLTCHTTDNVFESDYNTDTYYFDQVKQDVIRGKVIQGYDADEAEEDIEELIHNDLSWCIVNAFWWKYLKILIILKPFVVILLTV